MARKVSAVLFPTTTTMTSKEPTKVNVIHIVHIALKIIHDMLTRFRHSSVSSVSVSATRLQQFVSAFFTTEEQRMLFDLLACLGVRLNVNDQDKEHREERRQALISAQATLVALYM